MPRAYMTLLQRRPQRGHKKHTNDLPTKSHGSSPGGTRSLHLPSINADHPSARLEAAANDLTHGDDKSGSVSRKPSNLPTA